MATPNWTVSWGPPMCGCLYRGQVLLGGSYHTAEASFPADSRIVRWSEIGAFRFLGATAEAKKNEAGFIYTSEASSECVMALLPLKNAVVVYTTMSVFLLKPVSQPAPTYGLDEFISGVGILNPLAVAGHRDMHIFLDKEGNLREISMGQYGQGYEHKDLGFKHIFKDMQKDFNIGTRKGIVAVTYNRDEDEFYISDGIRSFVYANGGLTEIGVAISSYVNLRATLIADELFNSDESKTLGCATPLLNSEYMYFETDIEDFGMAAIKTITQVELGANFGSDKKAYVMIKWRNDRSSAFRSTAWKRCSPNGVATLYVSGCDFKVCVRISPVSGVVINNMTVEWQLSDKTSVRGRYVGGSDSKSD